MGPLPSSKLLPCNLVCLINALIYGPASLFFIPSEIPLACQNPSLTFGDQIMTDNMGATVSSGCPGSRFVTSGREDAVDTTTTESAEASPKNQRVLCGLRMVPFPRKGNSCGQPPHTHTHTYTPIGLEPATTRRPGDSGARVATGHDGILNHRIGRFSLPSSRDRSDRPLTFPSRDWLPLTSWEGCKAALSC